MPQQPSMADKILLIANHFPPAGGIQVQRALSLAKYLPQNGFDVHVLTTKYPQVAHYDRELLKQIPASVKVHRTWSLEPPFHLRKRIWGAIGKDAMKHNSPRPPNGSSLASSLRSLVKNRLTSVLSPDPQVLWYPFAVRRALKLIRRESIRTVLVTAPPFSTFLIGNELKRRFPFIRLVSEFRDEWLSYFLSAFAFRDDSVRAHAIEMEQETVELSDCIVAAAPSTLSRIAARYPAQPDAKFQLVYNGYDPELLSGFHSRPHGLAKIIITYAGTVYPPSDPSLYLDALDSLPPDKRSMFETRFIGRVAEGMEAVLRNRQSKITRIDFLPHRKMLKQLEETDFLLLPWNDLVNIPGKTFEYLATGKPIISLLPPLSDTRSLLNRFPSVHLFTLGGQLPLSEFLCSLTIPYNNVISVQSIAPASVKEFSRPTQVGRYADVIRGLSVAGRLRGSVAVGLPGSGGK